MEHSHEDFHESKIAIKACIAPSVSFHRFLALLIQAGLIKIRRSIITSPALRALPAVAPIPDL